MHVSVYMLSSMLLPSSHSLAYLYFMLRRCAHCVTSFFGLSFFKNAPPVHLSQRRGLEPRRSLIVPVCAALIAPKVLTDPFLAL